MTTYWRHVTGRVVPIETRAGLRHCLASPYWEEVPRGH